jgi:hypothetical protein
VVAIRFAALLTRISSLPWLLRDAVEEGADRLVITMIHRDCDAPAAGLGDEPGGLRDSAAIGWLVAMLYFTSVN